jgi:REP element-mobilizing transposase RayT
MRVRQLSFLPKIPTEHGGSLAHRKRKTARPIDPKQALHVVLRSSQARGERSMLHPKLQPHVDAAARTIATRHGVRLYRYANVGNHLHLLVRARTRVAIQRFLRDLAGTIAIIMTGAKKSNPLASRFWDGLAYTRIVSWGREFRTLELYFIKNLFEAAGLLTRKAKALGLRVIPLGRWGP